MMLLFLDLNTVACTKRICLQYMTRAHKHCPFHYVVLLHIQAKKKMWMMNKLPSKIHHSTMRGFDSSDKQATATHTMTQTGMEGFRDIISGHHFCHKKWLTPMYSKKIYTSLYTSGKPELHICQMKLFIMISYINFLCKIICIKITYLGDDQYWNI